MEMVHFIPRSQRARLLEAAQNDPKPILIVGAHGTGKSALARWIQKHSRRAPFSMSSASKEVPLAQQLPQHQGGTLYFDEISSWGLADQRILAEFLRTRTVESEQHLRQILNVRIIAATSHDLARRAEGGLFNSELLSLLSEFKIEMPSLQNRQEELPEIALGILEEITRELHREHLRSFSASAWDRLKGYEWPGNLRELRNVLKVAVVQAQGECIDVNDLPAFGPEESTFLATREEFERTYWTELLKGFNWQVDRVSEATRIDKNSLLAKIKRYGIDLPTSASRL